LSLALQRFSPLDLPGVLGAQVRDWHIVDSMTVRLDSRIKSEYPGTGDYAALKGHKRFSVGLGTTWDHHLSPAREHDAPHLVIDESWRGLGALVDLGYASLQFLRDCERHDVKFVIRLKENWKPKVQGIEQGELGKTFLAGTDLDTLVGEEVLLLRGRSIDLDVTFGEGESAVVCRLVGIRGPKGLWYWYLTNLPRDAAPWCATHQATDPPADDGPDGRQLRRQHRQSAGAQRRRRRSRVEPTRRTALPQRPRPELAQPALGARPAAGLAHHAGPVAATTCSIRAGETGLTDHEW